MGLVGWAGSELVSGAAFVINRPLADVDEGVAGASTCREAAPPPMSAAAEASSACCAASACREGPVSLVPGPVSLVSGACYCRDTTFSASLAAAALTVGGAEAAAAAVVWAEATVVALGGAAAGSTFADESSIPACAAAANVSEPTPTASSVSALRKRLRPTLRGPGGAHVCSLRLRVDSVAGSLRIES